MRKSKKDDSSECWESFLLYTDNCLVISLKGRGEKILQNEIHPKCELKEELIGRPYIYL